MQVSCKCHASGQVSRSTYATFISELFEATISVCMDEVGRVTTIPSVLSMATADTASERVYRGGVGEWVDGCV